MSTSLLGVGGTEQTEEGSPGTVHTRAPDLSLSPLSLEASAPDWSLPEGHTRSSRRAASEPPHREHFNHDLLPSLTNTSQHP